MPTATPLPLKIVIANYGHTAQLKDGSVAIPGVAPDFVKVDPIIAAFRRMVREVEFDVCELASTTYFIARAFGAPFKALPIFLMRRFHHGGIVCREDAGIRAPKDLEGKKVGVRAYSVTTGVWTRGVLVNEYGLDSSKVTWVVGGGGGEPRGGPPGGGGRGGGAPPKEGWEGGAKPAPVVYRDLIEDTARLEAEWFRRTGIYPMHGLIVVKDKLLAG